MNPLLTHLNQIRPYINAVAINELAGTENLLGKHFHYVDTNGEKGQLLSPKRYFDVLSALIKAFGIVKIGRWTYYSAWQNEIFGWSPQIKDVTEYKGNVIVTYASWNKVELIEHLAFATQELTTTSVG